MDRAKDLTLQLLHKALGLSFDWSVISEEEIITKLAERISIILQKGPDVFFQLMYGLDVSEAKLNRVMHETEAPTLIAKLVYERQLQKMQSRLDNKTTRNDNDADLDW